VWPGAHDAAPPQRLLLLLALESGYGVAAIWATRACHEYDKGAAVGLNRTKCPKPPIHTAAASGYRGDARPPTPVFHLELRRLRADFLKFVPTVGFSLANFPLEPKNRPPLDKNFGGNI